MNCAKVIVYYEDNDDDDDDNDDIGLCYFFSFHRTLKYLYIEIIVLYVERVMCETSVVVVVSPTKLSDEVTGPPVSHWLDPADSQTDPTVPQSLSNSESVTRPQTSSHDEPYELLQSERPFYSAAPPRPPLPSQPPSGMPSGGLFCVYCRRFPYRTDAITLKSISLYYT